jgi:hypothetical protein
MGLKGLVVQIPPLPIIILTLILRLATCGFHPRRGVEFHRAAALIAVLRLPPRPHMTRCSRLGRMGLVGVRAGLTGAKRARI